MEVPDFVKLKNGDNRAVSVPVWMAKDIVGMLEDFLEGTPRSKTPCYASEEEETVEDFKKLVELMEKPVNNSTL